MKAGDGDLETHHLHQGCRPAGFCPNPPKRSAFRPNFPRGGNPNWKSQLSVLGCPGEGFPVSSNASGWRRSAVCPPSPSGEPEMLGGEAQKLAASPGVGIYTKILGQGSGLEEMVPGPTVLGCPRSSPCGAGDVLPEGAGPPGATSAAAAGDGSRSTRFSLSFSPSGQMLSAGLHPALRHRAGRSPERFFWGSAQLRGPRRGGEGWKHRGQPGIAPCPPIPTRGLVPSLSPSPLLMSPPKPPSHRALLQLLPRQHGDGVGETQRGSRSSGKT